MKIAGIDFSTFAVDIVTVDLDDTAAPPYWRRYELAGPTAFDRVRAIPDSIPGRWSALWDDIVAVGIEEPQMRGSSVGTAYSLYRVQGAVLARIAPTKNVHAWLPSSWRKAVGAKGNASKEQVWQHAWELLGGDAAHTAHPMRIQPDQPWGKSPLWPYDAADAYCIARATRTAELEKVAA